jgi:hypothetical protein
VPQYFASQVGPGYIKDVLKRKPVKYQLTPRGEKLIRTHGISHGGHVTKDTLKQLCRLGDAHASIQLSKTSDPGQTELPL